MKQTMVRCAVLSLILVAVVGCGKRETPEQRLSTLRLNHEIIPVGVTTLHADTDPTLMVDLDVVNKGAVPLAHLTVLVVVRGADGGERLSRRVTLDLDGARPGVGERRSALIPGFVMGEADEVFVEIESGLSPEELGALPEFADL